VRLDLLHALIDAEIEVCLSNASVCRPRVEVTRDAERVLVGFTAPTGRGVFALDCRDFDASPPSVDMLDPDTLESLPSERWTPGVPHSLHPSTGRPFVCLQGVAEYHSHPSHTNDPWDRYRTLYRLPQTIARLLDKAGVPR
jgi:hypothetical protein